MVRTVSWWIAGSVAVAVLALGPAGTFAQYDYSTPKATAGGALQDAVKTAITHAGFAEKYDTMKEVTLHLHHVINCLVGPKDKMFDTSAGNPCQGQGNGIIADVSSGAHKDAQFEATWAAHIADQALAMKSLPEVKAGAHIVALTLADLQKTIK